MTPIFMGLKLECWSGAALRSRLPAFHHSNTPHSANSCLCFFGLLLRLFFGLFLRLFFFGGFERFHQLHRAREQASEQSAAEQRVPEKPPCFRPTVGPFGERNDPPRKVFCIFRIFKPRKSVRNQVKQHCAEDSSAKQRNERRLGAEPLSQP